MQHLLFDANRCSTTSGFSWVLKLDRDAEKS